MTHPVAQREEILGYGNTHGAATVMRVPSL